MKNQHSTIESADDPTYTKLVKSPLYQTYKKAFHDATGLHLALLPPDRETPVAEDEQKYANPFCRKINDNKTPCSNCAKANLCLMRGDGQRAETMTCFAGMRETAIPISSGGQIMAYLSTGQIFTEAPDDKDFDEIANALSQNGRNLKDLKQLKDSWSKGRVMEPTQYQGIVTLLAAFAIQLSEMINRLVLEETNSVPAIVTKAKQYVNANLEDKVCLDDVAKRVGVSSFYFCKVFKKATGMTLTEYVNRRRVEWAKRMLANPHARVTEVAYEVGYQSLSQFNRSFLKYVGMSPTRFRQQQSSDRVMARNLAA